MVAFSQAKLPWHTSSSWAVRPERTGTGYQGNPGGRGAPRGGVLAMRMKLLVQRTCGQLGPWDLPLEGLQERKNVTYMPNELNGTSNNT